MIGCDRASLPDRLDAQADLLDKIAANGLKDCVEHEQVVTGKLIARAYRSGLLLEPGERVYFSELPDPDRDDGTHDLNFVSICLSARHYYGPGRSGVASGWQLVPLHLAASCREIARRLRRAMQTEPAGNAAGKATPQGRRGRLAKDDSAGRRMNALSLIQQHPSLQNDSKELAQRTGVSEKTVKRWQREWTSRFRARDDEE